MPAMNNKSTFLSNLVSYIALGLIFAPILAAMFNPQFPLWLAILFIVAVGFPVLVLGMLLHPEFLTPPNDEVDASGLPVPNASASKKFWPTRTEAWGMAWGFLGLITLCATVLAPCLLFLPLLFLLPAGDNWAIVIARILLATIAFGISYWWIEFAMQNLPNLFRGKLSDATIDSFLKTETPKEPGNAREAMLMHWQLLVFAAVAFLVAYGVFHFKNPGPILQGGPRRLRGIIRLITWCRGNPNTVMSSSVLVGIGAMVLYLYHAIRASVRSNKLDPQTACSNPMDQSGESAAS